jgi:hypothetical protein
MVVALCIERATHMCNAHMFHQDGTLNKAYTVICDGTSLN